MQTPITQPENPYEILRRLENIVRVGTIAEVRHGQPARCRVRTGNITTAWVPWLAQRAGGNDRASQWWPPVVGEQCLLLAPGGDLLNAIALPGIYSDANAQPSTNEKICLTEWGNGDFMEHDSEFSKLTINCQFSIVLKAMESTITMNPDAIELRVGAAALVIDKNGITATPDISARGISLVDHVHAGVAQGNDLSGAAQ